MPFFVSGRELRRLERERNDFRLRAEAAELRLEKEREAKDRLILNMADRVFTSKGTYAVSPVEEKKVTIIQPALSAMDEAKREAYKKFAVDAGRTEADGIAVWEAEMRGEGMPYLSESEQ